MQVVVGVAPPPGDDAEKEVQNDGGGKEGDEDRQEGGLDHVAGLDVVQHFRMWKESWVVK